MRGPRAAKSGNSVAVPGREGAGSREGATRWRPGCAVARGLAAVLAAGISPALGGVGFSAVTFTTNVIALRVSAFDLAWAALLSAVIGLIGGWFPALRAARLRPVEALRRA